MALKWAMPDHADHVGGEKASTSGTFPGGTGITSKTPDKYDLSIPEHKINWIPDPPAPTSWVDLTCRRGGRIVALGDAPPWYSISSRRLSPLLGVTLQTLANWRIREYGPVPRPHRPGDSHRVFYVVEDVMAWIRFQEVGETVPGWAFSARWLDRNWYRFPGYTEAQTRALIVQLTQGPRAVYLRHGRIK